MTAWIPRVLKTSFLLGVALLGVFALISGGSAWADEGQSVDRVHLQNGKVFTGRIVATTTEAVTLEMTSDTGASGRMVFPRRMIRTIERGAATAPTERQPGCVRDAWYLLKSGNAVVGARHLVLRQVRSGGVPGWRMESTDEHFARGRHVPPVKIQRMERVDLKFQPLQIYYREIGEGSAEPGGPVRYETSVSGSVSEGMLNALIYVGDGSERRSFALPAGGRARLGTREHLLRSRTVGLQQVSFLDPDGPRTVQVLAGYTALDVLDRGGRPYDQFVWEEDGVRLVSRLRDCEILDEQVAEGVTAVPATEAQVDAARSGAGARAADPEPGLVRLAELGLAYKLPDASWVAANVETSPLATGWRKVAEAQSRPLLAHLRVEWDPTGHALAPTPDEAADRLLQRLRAVCPDLRVVHPRRSLRGGASVPSAWRMDFLGTLKGERVRTVAVVLDQGEGRALFLASCPEVSWAQASRSIESLVGSIKRL